MAFFCHLFHIYEVLTIRDVRSYKWDISILSWGELRLGIRECVDFLDSGKHILSRCLAAITCMASGIGHLLCAGGFSRKYMEILIRGFDELIKLDDNVTAPSTSPLKAPDNFRILW